MTYTVRSSPGLAVLTEGLGRRFGDTRALRDLDLAVEPGTVLGLLGHNGAGKTTAVRILTTLLAPSEGRAFVGGHDVVAAPGAVREQFALAGQQASLDERLTGRENLMLLARLQRLSKRDAVARTRELLDRFGIAHAADRQVGTYSGGMRRRLDLAACLVVHRPVVFLDEPTTGLDPASRQEMWGAVESLVADGVALVLTTQYLEEADRLADRIVVLADGRAVAAGTPPELKESVGERRVHLTLPDAGALQDAARLFDRLEPELDVRARRLSVPAPEGPRDLRAALDALEDAGVAVDEAALSQPTLDDAFFALTGAPQREQSGGEASGRDRTVAA
jgi:ABC-2 type transport system ATP-binding protein